MTRTIKFGEPSKEAQEIYNIVLEAETSAIQAIKPGIPLKDIDHIAENVLQKRLWSIFPSSLRSWFRITRT